MISVNTSFLFTDAISALLHPTIANTEHAITAVVFNVSIFYLLLLYRQKAAIKLPYLI
ncbi:hypothetical protein PPBDW_II1370 [Photobacterium kishitanii]|nr:hypothetical protein PPBDW_II1370 [Photobacterium kishitanii]